MTPNATRHGDRRRTDRAADDDPDLHPDVRAVMRATEALPGHESDGVPVIELPTETGSVRASIPSHASDREAAVIAVAITAHLRDEAAAVESSSPEPADPWRLCSRLGHAVGRSLRHRPRPGDTWKMAGRIGARR